MWIHVAPEKGVMLLWTYVGVYPGSLLALVGTLHCDLSLGSLLAVLSHCFSEMTAVTSRFTAACITALF